jgi:peptidoglycan/LPS O-acetylase OafA/YrhL
MHATTSGKDISGAGPSERARTLNVLGRGRDNNFNLLRMLAASAVIVSHSFRLSLGREAPEPLTDILPFALGHAAVVVFFALSGFFIIKSFLGRHSLTEFILARALRLFPGLLVVALITVLVIGPLFTTLRLSDYFKDWHVVAYVPRALSLFAIGQTLPGVFENAPFRNPYPVVNGTLWTLFYEVFCYAGLLIAGLATFFQKRRFPIFLLLYAVAYALLTTRIISRVGPEFAQLSLPFVIGMASYFYRERVPLNWTLMVVIVAAFLLSRSFNILFYETAVIALTYGAFLFGATSSQTLRKYNRLGDYSYGVYIYGWLVQQILVVSLPGIGPYAMMAGSLLCTLPLAVASWVFVEERALQFKKPLTDYAHRQIAKFA